MDGCSSQLLSQSLDWRYTVNSVSNVVKIMLVKIELKYGGHWQSHSKVFMSNRQAYHTLFVRYFSMLGFWGSSYPNNSLWHPSSSDWVSGCSYIHQHWLVWGLSHSQPWTLPAFCCSATGMFGMVICSKMAAIVLGSHTNSQQRCIWCPPFLLFSISFNSESFPPPYWEIIYWVMEPQAMSIVWDEGQLFSVSLVYIGLWFVMSGCKPVYITTNGLHSFIAQYSQLLECI